MFSYNKHDLTYVHEIRSRMVAEAETVNTEFYSV